MLLKILGIRQQRIVIPKWQETNEVSSDSSELRKILSHGIRRGNWGRSLKAILIEEIKGGKVSRIQY